MKFNNNHEWILDEPIITKASYFRYKYVVLHGDGSQQPEEGLYRIADLEVLPELKGEQTKFQEQQQTKIRQSIKNATNVQKHDERLQNGFSNVNNAKVLSLWDEWETYTLKFSVFEPFDDPKIDIRLQGNNP